jgi:cytochrome P450
MAAPVRAIPRLATRGLLGSLPAFRKSRLDFQLAAMREQPDIARARFGPFEVLLIGAPELVNALLVSQADDFVKSYGLSLFARPILGDGLLTSEHALHRRQRRLIAPAFGRRQVEAYAALMAERADQSLARMLAAGECEISAETMRVTLEIVGKTLFDSELADSASEVGQAVTAAMECVMGTMADALPLPPFVPSPRNLKLARVKRRLDQLVYALIRARRAAPEQSVEARGSARERHNDLLSILLAARDEDGSAMSDHQVRDEVMTALLAGHETTANALAWTLILLSQHAQARARVEAELDEVLKGRTAELADLSALPLTLATLKEAMRLYPPVYLLGRRALRTTALCGYPVRKNQVVLVATYGMQRRGDIFPEPERFEPERFLPAREARLPAKAFLPFGAGARTCIGNHFALLEGQLLLARWLSRARFELAQADRPIELEPLITLRPKAPVSMRVTAR